jgi:hypothetical protein
MSTMQASKPSGEQMVDEHISDYSFDDDDGSFNPAPLVAIKVPSKSANTI